MKKNSILEHKIDEWRYLNDYIIKMDLNYTNSISIVITVILSIAALVTKFNGKYTNWISFLIPPAIISLFSFVGYQFRITAILRGHLERLETEINEEIGCKVHMWNSALVEVYMAHNNEINRFLMMPISIFSFILLVLCLIVTYRIMWETNLLFQILFLIYWFIMLLCILVVFYSFINNENIRKKTTDSEEIWRKYNEYKAHRDK